MSNEKDIRQTLPRDGTTQSQRYPVALDPGFVSIDGRKEPDRVRYAYEFARLLNYYGLDNQPDGDWQAFFDSLYQHYNDNKPDPQGTLTPHQALFLTFIRLFEQQRLELNGLTKKHLDLYFRDILQLSPKKPEGDHVHLIFDLAKNAAPALLKKDTPLSAGKDADGNELTYLLAEDTIVNNAKVTSLKSIQLDISGKIHMATVSNSADGAGAAPEEGNPSWNAFGELSFPVAETGFAIASPILWLQEGTREITLKIGLKEASLASLPSSVLQNSLKIYLSGEKEWIGPKTVTPTFSSKEGGVSEMIIALTLDEDEEAVTFFNQKNLLDTFETLYPVMKIIPDTSATAYLGQYFHGVTVSYLQIEANVIGIKSLQAENDQGAADVSRPFQPFGPRPVKGSGCMIGYEEAFTKNLDSFELKVNWLDVPSSNLKNYFGSFYSGSDATLNYSLGSNAFRASLKYRKKGGTISSKTIDLFNPSNNQSQATISPEEKIYQVLPFNFQALAFNMPARSGTASLMLRKKREWFGLQRDLPLFSGVKQLQQAAKLRSGFIRLELLDDFLHQEYPKKYTVATVRLSKTGIDSLNSVNFPKEPYTPVIKTISLDYKASTGQVSLSGTSESDFLGSEIELFQLGAFGQREVHGYLNAQLDFLKENKIQLQPSYSNAGELFIGIKDAEPGQGISLLVQVAEGSSNPSRDKEPVSWHLLVKDQWKELDTDYLLADGTDGLIRSGIVKLKLPLDADAGCHWLDQGCHWIRASVSDHADAVCRLIGIDARAAEAVLEKPENHLEHLAAPLAASTVKGLQASNPAIKKVSQPYASFGGRTAETDKAFYTRVSERLRHKNRAVTLFDYEHLILEKFPQLHKVKCLNHTCDKGKLMPGHITIILVPDLTNQNALDTLQPRVSKAVLNDVRKFIIGLNSTFASVHVKNPEYEKVQMDFQVRFYKEYEFGYYSQQLNNDMISFLSPWVNGNTGTISFGGSIHKSVLLKFIEDRDYVDFVTNVRMYHLTGGISVKKDVEVVTASGGMSILVSERQHIITEFTEGS